PGSDFDLTGAAIDPIGHAGPFTPGSTAADFAGVFLIPITGNGYFALRNTTWNAVGGGFYNLDGAGNFDATGTQYSITAGTIDLQVEATVFPSEPAFLEATNGATSGNLSAIASQVVLSLPIDANFEDDRFIYHLTGNVVATATFVPEPSSFMLASFSLIGL